MPSRDNNRNVTPCSETDSVDWQGSRPVGVSMFFHGVPCFSRYNWISLELDFVGFVALVEKFVEMESRLLMVEAIIYVVGSIYRRLTVPQFIQDAFFPAVGHFATFDESFCAAAMFKC